MWRTVGDFRTLLSLFSPRVTRGDDSVQWNSRRRDKGQRTELSWALRLERQWELGAKELDDTR